MLQRCLLLYGSLRIMNYTLPDVDSVLAATLITALATFHGTANTGATSARAEKLKQPNTSSSGMTEDWQ